jgi:hypothetical protein
LPGEAVTEVREIMQRGLRIFPAEMTRLIYM